MFDYGMVKCKLTGQLTLLHLRHKNKLQYHIHAPFSVAMPDSSVAQWYSVINVGTNDSDDLLQFKLIFDFQKPLTTTLKNAALEFSDLTGKH